MVIVMYKSIRFTVALALLGLLPACSPASSSGSKAPLRPAKQPQLAKKLWTALFVEEKQHPRVYLRATGASYRNAQGQLVLQGHFENTASFAIYQNPVLLVTWFSKSYKKLGIRQYPLRALVKSQGAAPFEISTDAPPNVVSVGLDIATAAAIAKSDPTGLL